MKLSFRLLILVSLTLGAAAAAGDEPSIFTGTQTFTLEGGQHVALRWQPERRGFVLSASPAGAVALPDSARQALGLLPGWLVDDVRRRLEALHVSPIRIEEGAAKPSFRDVNGDGVDDLVILGATGKKTTFLGPHWIRTDAAAASTGIVAEIQDPARGDVDGDGRIDEVKGTEDGRILWRRNRGTTAKDGFLAMHMASRQTFPHAVGMASRPAMAGGRLVVGNLAGALAWFERDDGGIYRPMKKALEATPKGLGGFAAPALGSLTGREKPELVVGDERGGLFGVGPGAEKRLFVESFVSPCLADLDGDGDLDLICGSGDGGLATFRNTGGQGRPPFFEPDATFGMAGIDVGESSAPAVADLNGDGHADLIVGNQAGELRVFTGPDWKPDETLFAGLSLGELTAPALEAVDGGGHRLAVGRLDGDLLFYDISVGDDGKIRAVETGSWDFTPDQRSKDIAAYYERIYYPEWEEMRGANDAAAVISLAEVLAKAPGKYSDEIGFAIAHTPTEVLRAMVRMGNADLLAVNAERIYAVAGQVKYAELVEGGDYTTIAYRGDGAQSKEWTTAPREIYYWWVVHPRILYEIPSRIDESYWRQTAKQRGQTDSEWWKHEPEDGVHTSAASIGEFWREGFDRDDRFGQTLGAAVLEAKTLREAHLLTHRFLAKDAGGIGCMRFGYETQDLQPWLIYAKHYGSCGEHSIIGAAAARTMLIPAAVVGCRGEDHQWNEWWDVDGKWHHWDPSGPRGLDTPWGSSEGLNHKAKTVSTVTRWRGDDTLDHTTTTVHNDPKVDYTTNRAGYTDVCDVMVTVTDPKGRPVDGALVVVRSHWERRNLISTWGYTGHHGEVRFGLGFEPHGGYTIEALTPLGPCGVVNYPVVENTSQELTLVTPQEVPEFARVDHIAEVKAEGEPLVHHTAAVLASELAPPNFITAKRYRIGDHLTKQWGYRGTHRSSVPLDTHDAVTVLIFSPEEYEKFRAGEPCTPVHRADLAKDSRLGWGEWKDREYVTVLSNRSSLMARARVRVTEVASGDRTAPVVSFDVAKASVVSGQEVVIRCVVRDDRGMGPLHVDFPREVKREGPNESGEFTLTVDTGYRGPLPAGTYDLTVIATDEAHNETQASIPITVTEARSFPNQKIRQGHPDDPLKGGDNWVLGPFDLDGKDRFLLVRTKSATPEFDMDMHLYFDRNGNGRIDGAGERVAQSTSPTATERIYLPSPAAGTYWLHCQGWQVKGDVALLDVEVFPLGKWRYVGPVSPVGPIAAAPKEIRAEFTRDSHVDPREIRVLLDGTDVTKDCRVDLGLGRVSYVPVAALAPNVPHRVRVRIVDANGGEEKRDFSFTIDSLPPTLTLMVPADPRTSMEFLEVFAKDAAGPVTVTCRLPDGKTKKLRPAGKDRPDVFRLKLNTDQWKKGEHILSVMARDRVGQEIVKEVKIVLP